MWPMSVPSISHWYILYWVVAEKPTSSGRHCYDAPSTVAVQRRSDDFDDSDDLAFMTEPWWHHNDTCRLLAKECSRRARASLLSLCIFLVAPSFCSCSWGTIVCQRARACPLGYWSAFLHMYTEQRAWNLACIIHKCTKHSVYFRKSGNLCGALLVRNKSFSAYPLMTLPVWRPVIRPSFASIADMLREEFANKGWRLYEII